MSLKSCHTQDLIEAGCDEAGRGCLAGPVYSASVILPKHFEHLLLNDSKQLTHDQRMELRPYIEQHAISWAVADVSHRQIDKINILNASILGMHLALKQLSLIPDLILVDGNRFKKYKKVPHLCVVDGDAIYASIAAASVLAKTYRDDYMQVLHKRYPKYGWNTNKGYSTPDHKEKIAKHGITPHHRKSFRPVYENLIDGDRILPGNIIL